MKNTLVCCLFCVLTTIMLTTCSLGGDIETWRQKVIGGVGYSFVLGMDPNKYAITELSFLDRYKINGYDFEVVHGSETIVPPNAILDFWMIPWDYMRWLEHGTSTEDGRLSGKPSDNSSIIFYFDKPATNQAEPEEEGGEIYTTFSTIGALWSLPAGDEIRIDWSEVGTDTTFIAGPYTIEKILTLQNGWAPGANYASVIIANNSPGVLLTKIECWEPLY